MHLFKRRFFNGLIRTTDKHYHEKLEEYKSELTLLPDMKNTVLDIDFIDFINEEFVDMSIQKLIDDTHEEAVKYDDIYFDLIIFPHCAIDPETNIIRPGYSYMQKYYPELNTKNILSASYYHTKEKRMNGSWPNMCVTLWPTDLHLYSNDENAQFVHFIRNKKDVRFDDGIHNEYLKRDIHKLTEKIYAQKGESKWRRI